MQLIPDKYTNNFKKCRKTKNCILGIIRYSLKNRTFAQKLQIMTAVIIGATGAVGKDLLQLLLNDDTFTEVRALVRKPLSLQHPKLQEHIVNFSEPQQWSPLVVADVAFSCLGTTLKQAGSKERQRQIDVQYNLDFAKAAAANGVKTFVLVSSVGANSHSSNFYLQIKGELEDAVKNLAFSSMNIFQPSVLKRKDSDRVGEKLSISVLNFFNTIGLFRRYQPLSTERLAEAMLTTAKAAQQWVNTFTGNKIHKI